MPIKNKGTFPQKKNHYLFFQKTAKCVMTVKVPFSYYINKFMNQPNKSQKQYWQHWRVKMFRHVGWAEKCDHLCGDCWPSRNKNASTCSNEAETQGRNQGGVQGVQTPPWSFRLTLDRIGLRQKCQILLPSNSISPSGSGIFAKQQPSKSPKMRLFSFIS